MRKFRSVFKLSDPASGSLSWFPQQEVTRRIIVPSLDGMLVPCKLLPPPPAFNQISLLICWCKFIFLGGERHFVRRFFYPRTQHIDNGQILNWEFLTWSRSHLRSPTICYYLKCEAISRRDHFSVTYNNIIRQSVIYNHAYFNSLLSKTVSCFPVLQDISVSFFFIKNI